MPELRIITTEAEHAALESAARSRRLPSVSAYVRETVPELAPPRKRGRPAKPKPQTDSTSGARVL
jgi:hypothetical protein